MTVSSTEVSPTSTEWCSKFRGTRCSLGAILVVALVSLVSIAYPQGTAPTLRQQRSALDARNAQGLTPLVLAASAGDTNTVKSLIAAGASVDATDANGRTPLFAAVQNRQVEVAKTLVAAGAKLDVEARFGGSALNAAENNGDTQMATWLLAAGAHSTGKSVGDTVCVRSWGGEGYCGTVKAFTVRSVQLSVTKVIGCAAGCPAREDCSASHTVGGTNGLHSGEQVAVPSWCLTQTGVKQ